MRHPAPDVLERAVELGVRHIDTAAFYGTANASIRHALHPYDGLTIATMVGPIFGGPRTVHADPVQLRALVEENLEQLGVETLDLCYLRVGAAAPDPDESIGVRFEALAAMRDEGLIRDLGISNVTSGQLAEARSIAPVTAVQNQFGVLDQRDGGLVDECAAAGIVFTPFAALGGGLTKLTSESLVRVAEKHRATVFQVALAWGLARSPAVLQIPGTSSIAHLEENLTEIVLDASDMALLSV
jgi:aryl-alcohol dehydrogenase-like predicted oxidoreductase